MNLESRLRHARVVPVIRVGEADQARELIDRLLAAGLDVVELTTTIPGWPEVASALRSAQPDLADAAATDRPVTQPSGCGLGGRRVDYRAPGQWEQCRSGGPSAGGGGGGDGA